VPEYDNQQMLRQLRELTYEMEPSAVIYNKPCKMHRDMAFFSDGPSKGYAFAGQIVAAQPLSENKLLQDCLDAVNKMLQTRFNAILINVYKNGEKYIGAHSDAEASLDTTNSPVVGIAYGATRMFRIRDKKTGERRCDYKQQAGTLLCMEGDFQKEFKHEVPVEKKVRDERISLTFRCHVK
jgi:alkylated DNA repair dioxygenase AlkB